MAEVVSITDRRRRDVDIERFALLWGLVEQHKALIAKNPQPFLDRAAAPVVAYEKRMNELREVFTVKPSQVNDAAIMGPSIAQIIGRENAEVRRLLSLPIVPK